jgi:hypothetical protein
MREISVPYSSSVTSADGTAYDVRMIGHERCDGIWEGVIEFRNSTTRLSTGVETTQSNADAIEYWATGLERIYLEGALRRARRPGTRRNTLTRSDERRA